MKLSTLLLLAPMVALLAQENQLQTSDAGTDAVQTQAQVVPASPKKITAESRLKEALPKPFNTPGWKSEKKAMLSLGKYSFKCSDPANDKMFFTKRQFAAQIAVLLAKADMISRIKQQAEAYRSYKLFQNDELNVTSNETATNAMTTLSSGQLFGVTSLNQTEAWDGSRYEVAVMMIWSEKLEETARAIWIEKAAVQKPKGNGKTLDEWLASQEIACLSGPWQYVDKNGIRWFLGISASSIEGLTGAKEIQAKETAKLLAMGDALLSLRGDLYTKKAVSQTMVNNGDDQKILQSFLANLSEACKAEVSGLGEVYSDTVIHPFTGSEIYVSVYGISQNSVLEAISVEDRSVLSEQIFNRGQTIRAGRNAANTEAIRNSKNNPQDFQKGYNQQKRKFEKTQNSNQVKQPGKGQQGVSGGANVDLEDF